MKYARGSFITVPSREVLRGMHPTAQAIYMWLCAYANETDSCYPSRATLAKDARCSDRTVDEMLELLLEKGLIKKKGRKEGDRQLSNLYTVMIVDRGEGGSLPPSRTFAPPAKEVRTNSNHLTQTTEGGTREDLRIRRVPLDEDERERLPRVIPSPYSIEAARDAWSNGELRLQVLNWFLTEKGLWAKATNAQKLKSMMLRHNSAAVRIAKAEWSPSELKKAKQQILLNERMENEWTLETIEKYLTK